jgi:hypothetical protein
MSRFSKWSLSLRLRHQNSVGTYSFLHMSHMPRASHSFWFHPPDSTSWTLKVMRLLVLQYPPFSCYLLPHRLKYFPQHLFSNTLSLHFFLNLRDEFLHLYKTTGKIIFLYILIFIFSDSKDEDRRFYNELNRHSMGSVCSSFVDAPKLTSI